MATPQEELKAPTVLIDAGNETFVFHLWERVQIREEMELTDKPTLGGGRDQEIVRALPPGFTFTVKASDEVIVPVVKNGALHQDDISRLEQIDRLRNLRGRSVEVTSEKLDQSVSGIVRNVTVTDDGRFDNISTVRVEVRSFAKKETLDGTVVGDVISTKIEVPLSQDVGSDEEDTLETAIPGTVPVMSGVPGGGGCSVTEFPSRDTDWGDVLTAANKGAAVGAGIGGTIGTFIAPGAGTAVGAGLGAAAGLVGGAIFGTTPAAQNAEPQSTKRTPPLKPDQLVKVHTTGDVFIDGKKVDIDKRFKEIAENSKDEWINLHHDIPQTTLRVVSPDRIEQTRGGPGIVASEGETIGRGVNLRDEIIRLVKGHISPRAVNQSLSQRSDPTLQSIFKNEARGFGFLLEEGDSSLPPSSFRLNRQEVLDYTEPQSHVIFEDSHGHSGPDILVRPAIYAAFASRAYKNTIAKTKNNPAFGDCHPGERIRFD